MRMKKIILIVIALVTYVDIVNAQIYNKIQMDLNIQKMIKLKVDFEKFRGSKKGDSIFKLYQGQINNIKDSSKVYLDFIKISLKKEKSRLLVETIAYKNLTVVESNISLRRHLIKKIDLYNIIKYYLLKKNDSILPGDFRGLPVVDEKNYNGYDKNKTGEYKIAAKFLLNKLSLTHQEIKFIKNCDNQVYVLDIKKYLDTYGLNSENITFIKWAVSYLIKYPGVSIAYLDNSYEPIRSKNYMPKDRGR